MNRGARFPMVHLKMWHAGLVGNGSVLVAVCGNVLDSVVARLVMVKTPCKHEDVGMKTRFFKNKFC